MKFFKAIGNFFARIGRWIKNTAWIQPLLIVGGIFAIIFSIPYITKWVGSWFTEGTAAEKYYNAHKVSLDNADKGNSDVDKLFSYLADPENEDNAKAKAKYGDKFFVTLVQDNCSSCEERYVAFQTLEDNWNKNEFTDLDGSFKLFTIYVDTTDDGDNLFENVYNRADVQKMFETAIESLQDQSNHPYAKNSNNASNYGQDLSNIVEATEITTPTTFLIDFTNEGKKVAPWTTENGIREILFSFESTGDNNDYGKARTLRDAWTNVQTTSNMFSPSYKKS